jgi:hypothetical protein
MLRIARGWWQQSPITREITKEIVKTIAQGMPARSANLWWTNSCAFFAREAAGAHVAPGIPCALSFFGGACSLKLGPRAGRERLVHAQNGLGLSRHPS